MSRANLHRWARRYAGRGSDDDTVAKIQREAKAAGATLANAGHGGLDPKLALRAFRKAGWRCGNPYCPTPKEDLDLDHSSGHPKEIFESLKQWKNPKLRAAATRADGPKDDNYVSVLCAKCHDAVHERERALENGNTPPPMRGTGQAPGESVRDWANRKAKADRGGEGSRGGHVIGHTKSGKPIYAPKEGHPDAGAGDLPHRGQAFAGEHGAGYSRQDHYDARKILMATAKLARAEGKTAHAFHLGAIASGHKNIARGHDAYGASVKRGQN